MKPKEQTRLQVLNSLLAEHMTLDQAATLMGGSLYGQALSGDRLVNGVYQPIEIITEPDGEMWGYSEVLGVSFCYKKEMLVAYDRESEQYVMTDIEEHAAYMDAQAELQVQQAELEAAQARVRELEEQLRRRESQEKPDRPQT